NSPRLVDGEEAFTGAAANTAGLSGGVLNEMKQNVSPSLAGKNSYARGSGLELGLGTTVPDSSKAANQAIIAGLAQQSAFPVNSFGDTPGKDGSVVKEVGPIPGDPLVYASLLRGQAAARWNPNFCVLGAPLGFGLGFAADAELLNAASGGAKLPDPGSQPIVATDTNPNGQDVAQTKSFTYLRPTGDGTFAVVSETREELAPVTLFKGTPNQVTIHVGGQWVLRAVATGKPGGAAIEYQPPKNVTPLVTIEQGGTITSILNTDDIFGPGKLPTQISIPPAPAAQYLA